MRRKKGLFWEHRTGFRLLLILLSVCTIGRLLPIFVFADEGVYRSVETDSKRIALTFDDGPHPVLTQKILSILEKYNVKATFFMVGVNVVNYPEAANAVIRAGHEVGNHTFSHHTVTRLDEATMHTEIERCEDVLRELCEYRPHIFRPPQGAINPCVTQYSKDANYSVILWSLDTRDWEIKDAASIAQSVLSRVQGGDIILMHDYIGTNSKTPEALEIILPKLLAHGFEPVTVRELLGN